jgi:sugar/nucleoside kinase (ribokinase family)
MDPNARLLRELPGRRARLAGRPCLVGFDGFVDSIVSPVARRTASGDAFTPYGGIAEFGRRIVEAAGQSANIELVPQREKLGGNGPIMAGALLALGAAVTCAGAFGRAAIHPVFAGLALRARLVPLAEPARTTALEFPDGKLMFGVTQSLEEITPERLAAAFGPGGLERELAAADLVVLGNWTMIPHLTEVFAELTGRWLPALPPRAGRRFFFDLADPGKRAPADLRAALAAIARFEPFGRATLGLNLSEARQVAAALGTPAPAADGDSLRAAAEAIRGRLGLAAVVIHPKESAACATPDGSWWVPGPHTDQPLISTGAGDHFNAGFAGGQLLDLDPEACLALGVAASGLYVRTGESPSLAGVENFLVNRC